VQWLQPICLPAFHLMAEISIESLLTLVPLPGSKNSEMRII